MKLQPGGGAKRGHGESWIVARRCVSGTKASKKQAVLFCKKEPKNFSRRWSLSDGRRPKLQWKKVFWFFFSKKNRFLTFALA
jgi:hypothetical protein